MKAQSDRFSFNELVQASTLASFTSDLAEKYRQRWKLTAYMSRSLIQAAQ